MSDDWLDRFFNNRDQRTGPRAHAYRKQFLEVSKTLSPGECALKITEEQRLIRDLLEPIRFKWIRPEHYHHLRDWYLELEEIIKKLPNEAFSTLARKGMCRNCGGDLTSDAIQNHRWYCGEECRKFATRQRKKRWREVNSEKQFRSLKKYYRNTK